MVIIPAIDLKDGKCVRLLQGRKEDVTVYSDDPVRMARQWAGMGAELLHVVDLDGAFSGKQSNLEKIGQIREAITIPMEVGGGIRDMQRIADLIGIGIERTIIGTSAAENPEMVREACEKYPGQILAGIDARDGKVAVRGWEETTGLDALDFGRTMESQGVAGIIYTDIARDGMLTGPNVDAMKKMVSAVGVPVIASGGVSRLEDIAGLGEIENLWGVITGKALYSGALNLREAIELVKGKRN